MICTCYFHQSTEPLTSALHGGPLAQLGGAAVLRGLGIERGLGSAPHHACKMEQDCAVIGVRSVAMLSSPFEVHHPLHHPPLSPESPRHDRGVIWPLALICAAQSAVARALRSRSQEGDPSALEPRNCAGAKGERSRRRPSLRLDRAGPPAVDSWEVAGCGV